MDNQQGRFKTEVRQYKDLPLYVAEDGTMFNAKGEERSTHLHRSGYLRVEVMVNRVRYILPVHRTVAELYLDPPSEELIDKCSKEHWGKVLVCHKDNNVLNNHYTNLYWGSLDDNTKQAFRDELVSKSPGEKNGQAKLTNELVHEICKFYESGGSRQQAEVKFDISRHQAYSIYTRRKWLDISQHYKF